MDRWMMGIMKARMIEMLMKTQRNWEGKDVSMVGGLMMMVFTYYGLWLELKVAMVFFELWRRKTETKIKGKVELW